MSNETRNTDKLKYALKKFLDPEFRVKNEAHLISLLTYLTDKHPEGLEDSTVLEKEYLKTWIVDAFSLWKVTKILPDKTVLAFAVRILALLSKKDQHCFDLGNMTFFENFINVLKLRDENSSPEVRLAFVELLSSILEHDSGVDFLIITGYWEDVLKICLRGQTIDLTNGAIRLLGEFLGKASLTHEGFCTNVLQLSIKPFKYYFFNNGLTQTDFMLINVQKIYNELLPTLHLLINVMKYAYDKQLNFEPEAKLAVIILENMDVEIILRNIMLVAKIPDFFCDVMKIITLSLLIQLLTTSKDGVCSTNDLNVMYTKINELGFAFMRENIFYVSRIMYHIMCYWNKLTKSTYQLEDVCWDKKKIIMENQLAVMQILPFCGINSNHCHRQHRDEFENHFIDAFLKKSNHHTISLIYKWRVTFDWADNNYLTNFHNELPYIMKSREMYSRENVAIIFTCYLYYIKYAITKHAELELLDYFNHNFNFVADILTGMNIFIREFNIKWTDTFESICMLNTVYDFLNIHTWDSKIVEAGIKLITTSIEKYMTPNMTLLIDRTNDSTISYLGPFLVAKLYDPEWQIRNSILETISVIADVSKCKFPSFRKILLDVYIPQTLLEISLNDEERFVRATALKCLGKMCLVKQYWDNSRNNCLSTLKVTVSKNLRINAMVLSWGILRDP